MKLEYRAVAVCLALGWSCWAQPAPNAMGHWEGAIKAPNQELAINVDLAKDSQGAWVGTIDIPPQNLKGFPLSGIAVSGTSVKFLMKGPPGDPAFDGRISADGKTLSGEFSQGGGTTTFSLTRSGDAKIEAPAKSTSIAKEMEGTWEGILEAGGNKFRLILKLANQADGAANGSIISVDQGGGEIPVTTITQKDAKLKLVIASIAASYEGELKDGAIGGEWNQGPGSLPLTFKRAAPAKQGN